MSIPALILADGQTDRLEPVASEYLPAMLPVAGKPVLQHCIEDLWEAGVREVVVAAPSRRAGMIEAMGNGSRLGMAIRYLPADGEQRPDELLAASGLLGRAGVIVARGDVLRARVAARLLLNSQTIGPDIVHATSGGRHTGMAFVRRRCAGIGGLAWVAMSEPVDGSIGALLDLGRVEISYLDSLASLHRAFMGALEGHFEGLVPDGRTNGDQAASLAPRAVLSSAAQVSGLARVGRLATVHRRVELVGTVDIGDRCVIDQNAQVIDSVVLPDSYVGRGARVQNAIVAGSWLYRADLDACQRVEDPLLLAGRMRAAG